MRAVGIPVIYDGEDVKKPIIDSNLDEYLANKHTTEKAEVNRWHREYTYADPRIERKVSDESIFFLCSKAECYSELRQ